MPYVNVNGARLFYEEAGAGPPVVLVHGGLGDLRMWDGVVPLLAVSHRVVRFDVRGFGRTETAVGKFSPHEDSRAELESDHYLPMREPEAFAQRVREFLS